MALDFHNSIRSLRVISPVSLGATGSGGKTGVVVDRAGYEGVDIEVSVGAVTATNATVTLKVLEGDVTGTMTTAASTSLITTANGANLIAGTPRTSGVQNTGQNWTARVGYIGVKRYVSAKLIPTISGGITAGANVLLGGARKKPTAA